MYLLEHALFLCQHMNEINFCTLTHVSKVQPLKCHSWQLQPLSTILELEVICTGQICAWSIVLLKSVISVDLHCLAGQHFFSNSTFDNEVNQA